MPNRPILLMVTVQDWGGAQAYVFGLAKEMKARGLPVVICAGSHSLKDDSRKSIELSDRCRAAGIEFMGLRWMVRDINPINNLLSLFEMVSLFRRVRPRAILLNSSMMGVVGSLAAKLTRVPRIVYVAHGWVFEENLPAWRKRFYICIEKLSARWKDIIICLHPKDEALARSLKIKPRGEIMTIPNGIDVGAFEASLLERDAARSSLLDGRWTIRTPKDDQDVLVGTVANAYPPKNLLWYLEVCKAAHEKKPELRFVIIGDGPQMEELRRKHAALGQDDYVLLAGRRLDAPSLYRAFDIFVLPSSKEGMSMTLLEAMAAHVPCVATDVGAASWMLAPDSGIIVKPDDIQAMVNAIMELAADESRRRKLADQAYAQIKSRFTWKRAVDEVIKSLYPPSATSGTFPPHT